MNFERTNTKITLIEDYYNHFDEDKRLKRRHGQVEFNTNMFYIHKFLNGDKNKRILDVGAGTGAYSIPLFNEGYNVEAIELVSANIEKFKKSELYVTRENAIPLEEGEYYLKDLYGLRVHTDDGEDLGIIDDIIETGANDVYVVKGETGEIMIPNIRQCVLNVDLEAGSMEVHLIDGLRDL